MRPVAVLGLTAFFFACTSTPASETEQPVAHSESEQRATPLRVGLFAGDGAGEEYVVAIANVLAGDPRFTVRKFWDGSVNFWDFDVTVFPGGVGSTEWNALGADGQEHLKTVVNGGRGYVGICAGFYMALPGEAGFFDADIYWPWARGEAWLEVDVPNGNGVLSTTGSHWLRYVNGPVIYPLSNPARFTVLATFGTSVGEGIETMVGKPAVVGAKVGDGRAVAFSPHPELSGVGDMLKDALVWAAPVDGSVVRPEPIDPCRGFNDFGKCTGTVLEWCENGQYKRVDCAEKTDGRVRCGEDPRPEIGLNCVW
jgi:hypothetical protein